MKVILQQDIKSVGKEGDVITVADGYARNYLFPRKLAIEAAGGALKNVQLKHAQEERRTELLRAKADQSAGIIEGKTVRIEARAGTGDRLYGSITSQDIADAIKRDLGVTVDKRKILMPDPIKAMGKHSVPVKLHRDVTVSMDVEVVKAA